ncbi:hypothetical protein BJ684DRAFT_21012 [Piptocephalis cylindrospora]|uniref:Uncharacterized protein n=1 Tax=Piptocephalis cylindrospora TaxID=1907219 RepID=A0A4P9Y113_9FUNG|nr:hypothetical protein BJ684DRAFT_21012 [Piptocephalis cylindrospora]|eukprot:RKP12448.1 hypothetical protein BJ684DRAFT_21012 [Piptocephalis cylindrospora]
MVYVERRLDGDGPRVGKPQRSGERWVRVLGAECTLRFLVGLSTRDQKPKVPWTRWWADRANNTNSSNSNAPTTTTAAAAAPQAEQPTARTRPCAPASPNLSRASSTDFSLLPRIRRPWWLPSSVIKFSSPSSSSSSSATATTTARGDSQGSTLRGATSMIEIRSLPGITQQNGMRDTGQGSLS